MGLNKEFSDWWSVYAQSRLAVSVNICEIARDAYRAGREKTLYTMVDKKPTHNKQSTPLKKEKVVINCPPLCPRCMRCHHIGDKCGD